MSKCDLCQENHQYGLLPLHAHLASSDIQKVCGGCADIVSTFISRTGPLLDKEVKRFEKKLQKRLQGLRDDKLAVDRHWFLTFIGMKFQKKGIRDTFDLTKPLWEDKV